jgi:hypothetical protein
MPNKNPNVPSGLSVIALPNVNVNLTWPGSNYSLYPWNSGHTHSPSHPQKDEGRNEQPLRSRGLARVGLVSRQELG